MIRTIAACAALLLVSCAAPVLRERLPGAAVSELTQTPFYPQTEYQCGPAALATVLAASGVAVTPEQLVPQVFLPGRRGSLQVEMLAAARRQGRLALPVDSKLQGLAAALAAGQPVLVLQNLGLGWWPVWHYAVVIGLDPLADEVLLRSGTEARQRMPALRFLASWKRAGYWGFTVAEPDQVPTFAEARTWLEAAAPMEATGQASLALAAYTAATRRWPQNALAWQLLGNGRYAAGNRPAAIGAWRQALSLAPLPETYNNLAYALGEEGCQQESGQLIEAGLVAAAESPWRARLQQTQQELAAMPRKTCRQ